jgi:sirohydrochlorin ferrochelatase
MCTATQSAAILIGHGSLLQDSGRAMQQVAVQLQEQQVAPLVKAAFLNYSRPTLAEVVADCHRQGTTQITVAPYFLIAGAYVTQDLPATLRSVASHYPDVRFQLAAELGDHPALVRLARKRLTAVDPQPNAATALLFVAHGTPLAAANAPIGEVLKQVQSEAGYGPALVGYLDCNQPDIPTAFAQLVRTGVRRIAVLPYFLQLGRHVRKDLPALFAQAQLDYPAVELCIAEHLGYDQLLAAVVADRITETLLDKVTRWQGEPYNHLVTLSPC